MIGGNKDVLAAILDFFLYESFSWVGQVVQAASSEITYYSGIGQND
jgi:hypothetical protein